MRILKYLGILTIVFGIHSCNGSTDIDKYKAVTEIVSTPLIIDRIDKNTYQTYTKEVIDPSTSKEWSMHYFKIAKNIESESFLVKSKLKVRNKRFELRINDLGIFANPNNIISFFKYKNGKILPPPNNYNIIIYDNFPFVFNKFFDLEIIGEKDLITLKFNDKKVMEIIKEFTERPLSIELEDSGCNLQIKEMTLYE